MPFIEQFKWIGFFKLIVSAKTTVSRFYRSGLEALSCHCLTLPLLTPIRRRDGNRQRTAEEKAMQSIDSFGRKNVSRLLYFEPDKVCVTLLLFFRLH